MDELKEPGPVGSDMLMAPSLPSTSSFLHPSWSISSPHTMPKPPSSQSEAKEGSEPEIDLIDGATILSFLTLQDMEDFTEREERNQKHAERKRAISERKKRCENRSIPSLDEPKSKSRLSLDSALEAVNSKSCSSKSAFVSDLLDDYLNQTKEELNGKQFRNPEYFGAPPEDSKIYSTGCLNMDNVKKPFTVLPTVSNVNYSSNSDADLRGRKSTKCTLKRSRDQDVDHIKDVRIKTPKIKKIRPKNNKVSDVGSPRSKESAFSDLMAATNADIQARKNQGSISVVMDDVYARFALESFRMPTKTSPRPKESRIEEKVNDDLSDVAKMISRHSKRDIRLPARFHNTNIMIGNEWVTPTLDLASDKKGRKRLLDEQKRLVKKSELVTSPSSKKKSADLSVSNRLIKELHKKVSQNRELQAEKLLIKKEVQIPDPEPKPEEVPFKPEPTVKLESSTATSLLAPVVSASEKCVMNRLNLQLKELYRDLYYANVPDRKVHFQMKGVKPRVNKFQTVEEAIEVINKLQKRESQLNYIHKLMSMWNTKLDLCRKVVTKEADPEPTPDGKDVISVVGDVLKAYQSSVCYKLQEALIKKEFPEDQNQVVTKSMNFSSPRTITTTAVKDQKLEKKEQPNQVQVNGSSPRIIKKEVLNGIGPSKQSFLLVNGKGQSPFEAENQSSKSESILLPRPAATNVIRILPEQASKPRNKMFRLSGPRVNFGKGRNGFISVLPASFKSTSSGPIVTLDPKGGPPNAFAIQINGPPPVTAKGEQFATFRMKAGSLVPVKLPHDDSVIVGDGGIELNNGQILDIKP